MTRLRASLLRRARRLDYLLVPLLKTCRNVEAASRELQWLRDHFNARCSSPQDVRKLLFRACMKRSRGVPLQYILGTEFFGDLELQVRAGVLIPRQETAMQIEALAAVLKSLPSVDDKPPTILDLCSGTGCMSLLLQELLAKKDATQNAASVAIPEVLGIDLSLRAVALARRNVWHAKGSRVAPTARASRTRYRQADILQSLHNGACAHNLLTGSRLDARTPASHVADIDSILQQEKFEIVLANPPYVSPQSYWSTLTARSVRNFEPRNALIPPLIETQQKSDTPSPDTESISQEDLFYPAILRIARQVQSRVVLMEVADMQQALRVCHYAKRMRMESHVASQKSFKLDQPVDAGAGYWDTVEIWRDDPTSGPVEAVELPQPSGLGLYRLKGDGVPNLGVVRGFVHIDDIRRLQHSSQHWKGPQF